MPAIGTPPPPASARVVLAPGTPGATPRRAAWLIAAIIAAGILFVVMLWTATFVLIHSEQQTAIINASANASNLSAAFQEELSGELDAVSAAMELVAQRMRATPAAPEPQNWTHDLALVSPPVIEAAILGPDGRLQSTSTNPHPPPIDLSDDSCFRGALGVPDSGWFVSEPRAGGLTHTLSLKISRRVDSPDGHLLGVIVFALAPAQLTELHRAIDLGPNGIVTVLGTDNVIRARFGATSPDGTTGVGQALPAVPKRLATGDLHDIVHIGTSRIDGVPRLYSDRRLEHYPLIVSVGLALAQIRGPAQIRAHEIEATAAIVTVLLCALLTALISELRRRSRHEVQLAHERSALTADIALRREVEQRLRESEQKFQDIAEVSGDWIWETDADHRFTSVTSDAFTDTTRRHAGMTIGRTRWDVAGLDPEQDDNLRGHKADLNAHRPFRMFRYQVDVGEGQVRHFVVSGKPVFDAQGRFLGHRGTASDETPMVEAMQRAEQAEGLLRDAIDHLSEGFVIYDKDDRMVICNEAYRRMYPASAHLMVPGVTFETLLRNTLVSGEYPEAAGREEEWVAQFLRVHRDAVDELETQSRNGRWVLVSERRMRNGGLAGLRVDITEFKHIQAALRASERRLRDFAEMASDWFWEQDADNRFVWFSEGADLWNSISLVHKARWELFPNGATPEQWEAHKADIATRRPFRDFRYRLPDRHGEMRHVSISGVPQFDADGGFIGYRGVGRDITAQTEAEQELERAKERAEQAETLLHDAVDSISEGLVIYDRNDRLVMCNDAYRQIYSDIADLLQPGVSFEDMLRRVVDQGSNLVARGQEETWLAERLRLHREAKGASENHRPNDSWYLATDRRMKNGGIAGLRIDITALKQAQAALRESEERLDRAQTIAGIGSWELDVPTGRYHWSKETFRIRGLDPETFAPDFDNVAQYVHPDDAPAVHRWIMQLIAGNAQNALDTRVVRPDGEMRVLRVEGRPTTDPYGQVCRVSGTMQDITERRLIERQLAQAQKMDAIGNLTGGMAHDFNNVLGVIIGNLDLLKRLIGNDAAATELCSEALDGASRCAELVRRLLAFARRQSLHPEITDVNAQVADIARLLGRVLGEDISLNLQFGGALHPVMADQAQLEAALVNFATNARDAMPNGGRLDIITRNVALDVNYIALHPDVVPGRYVEIEITDTGTGIPPDIIHRIFEPFFTTKPPGRGTGLGLSMAFGFVKQSGGHLTVYSEPGVGTTFRIYLPATITDDATPDQDADVTTVATGTETILLVEDNAPLRRAVARQLGEFGYQVMDAEHADAALALLTGGPAVDLLFTDLTMPGNINGIDLAQRAVALRPNLKVLLTSGFPGARAADLRKAKRQFPMLIKPYRRDELARAVREALDDGPDKSSMATMRHVARAGATSHNDNRDREGERV